VFRLLKPEEVFALPPEQLTIELFCMYEASGFDYQKFCEWLDLDPLDDDVFEWAYMIHAQYAEAWRVLGTEEFDRQLDSRRAA
jgi:hypothetical protein